MGIGRTVMYGFVANETFESLKRLFIMFSDMMGAQGLVKTMVMDKMQAQMRAAKLVFNCDIMLCYFHVKQAIRRHVSLSFNINFPLQTKSWSPRLIFHKLAMSETADEWV